MPDWVHWPLVGQSVVKNQFIEGSRVQLFAGSHLWSFRYCQERLRRDSRLSPWSKWSKFLDDVSGQPHLQGSRIRKDWKIGLVTLAYETDIFFPETSLSNYHYSLRNNPEEHSSRTMRGFFGVRGTIGRTVLTDQSPVTAMTVCVSYLCRRQIKHRKSTHCKAIQCLTRRTHFGILGHLQRYHLLRRVGDWLNNRFGCDTESVPCWSY
jgi:hypothetical protein